MRPPRLPLVLLSTLLLSTAAAACDRAPSADGLKGWTPADHDGEKKSAAAAQGARGSSAPNMVEVAWQQQCVACHGAGGRGDGPQGPLNKTRDLTAADWQAGVKDEDIAAVIKTGRGKMPKFDLPDDIVGGLVARIRSFRGK